MGSSHSDFDSADEAFAQLANPGLAPAPRLALAHLVARRWPMQLLLQGGDLGIPEEQNRCNVVSSALANLPVGTHTLDPAAIKAKFRLQSERSLARLLVPLVERHRLDLAHCLRSFGLLHGRDLDLTAPAWRFRLHGRSAALMVAKALLEFHEENPFLVNLEKLDESGRQRFEDLHGKSIVPSVCDLFSSDELEPAERIELAFLVAKRQDNAPLAKHIWQLEGCIEEPTIRRELALTIAGSGRQFRDSFDALEDFADNLPALLLAHQEYLLGPKLDEVKGLDDNLQARTVARRERLLIDLDFMRLESRFRPDIRSRLYTEGIRILAGLDEKRDVSWDLLHHWLLQANEVHIHTDRGNLVPPFDQLLAAPAERLPWHEGVNYERWLRSATWMLESLELPHRTALLPAVEWLGKVRPPHLRMSLTRSLSISVHMAGAESFLRFAGSGRFHRNHMHGFAMLLHQVYDPAGPMLPDSLAKVLANSKLKDAKRMGPCMQALQTLVECHSLPRDVRRRLIELAATPDGEENPVDGFLQTLRMLAVVVRAMDQAGVEMADMREPLSLVGSKEELKALLPRLSVRAMPGSHRADALSDVEAARLEKNWQRFRTESRQPEALMAHTLLFRGDLQNKDIRADADAVLRAIDLYADAVVWADDSKAEFARLRYDIDASPHLSEIAKTAPQAWSAWRDEVKSEGMEASTSRAPSAAVDPTRYLRQRIVDDRHVSPGTYPVLEQVLRSELTLSEATEAAAPQSEEALLLRMLAPEATWEQRSTLLAALIPRLPLDSQFTRDLADLRQLLAPRGTKGPLRIVDSDDAEDLLLCGTEVLGSCQHVTDRDEEGWNRALMGYVLDGKYRMVAAKDGDGSLMARRMLRLLVDVQTRKPVVHLERLYHNPGIAAGDPVDRALIDVARKKALAMGCPLLCDDEDAPANEKWPNSVVSLGSRAPFEYVDANGGIESGEYDISDLRRLA